MARLKTRWNLKDRDRSMEQIAGVIGFNIWTIAADALLKLENEGFDTASNSQRLDVIGEFAVFLTHITDRLVYDEMEDPDRYTLITSLASHVANTMQDNRIDACGPGEYRKAFIDLVNTRMTDYSECRYSAEEGPGFTMKRLLGEQVRDRMGPKDNKWIPDYVIDAEVPRAVKALKMALSNIIGSTKEIRRSPVPEGGVWGEG